MYSFFLTELFPLTTLPQKKKEWKLYEKNESHILLQLPVANLVI